MEIRSSRQWYVAELYLRRHFSSTVDPTSNKSRRQAAADWKKYSSHVTQTIPFSIIRQDTHEKATRKGALAPRVFNIRDAEQIDEEDGAERPERKCFQRSSASDCTSGIRADYR